MPHFDKYPSKTETKKYVLKRKKKRLIKIKAKKILNLVQFFIFFLTNSNLDVFLI